MVHQVRYTMDINGRNHIYTKQQIEARLQRICGRQVRRPQNSINPLKWVLYIFQALFASFQYRRCFRNDATARKWVTALSCQSVLLEDTRLLSLFLQSKKSLGLSVELELSDDGLQNIDELEQLETLSFQLDHDHGFGDLYTTEVIFLDNRPYKVYIDNGFAYFKPMHRSEVINEGARVFRTAPGRRDRVIYCPPVRREQPLDRGVPARPTVRPPNDYVSHFSTQQLPTPAARPRNEVHANPPRIEVQRGETRHTNVPAPTVATCPRTQKNIGRGEQARHVARDPRRSTGQERSSGFTQAPSPAVGRPAREYAASRGAPARNVGMAESHSRAVGSRRR